jgi:small subunit ribosomal protein S6
MSVTVLYETILVFSTKNGEESVAALTERFKTLISQNAAVSAVDEWGKRRLAYPIKDETEGFYVLVRFRSAPDFPGELDRVLKITDGVLRSLIVKLDTEPEVPTEKTEDQPKEENADA